jgi:hypothetical protein
MLKRILLTIAMTFMVILHINAQQTDQVVLKNGTIIRGTIVKIQPEGNVTINDMAGNTWVYAMSEVEEIQKTDTPVLSRQYEPKDPAVKQQLPGFDPGFVNMTSIGFLAGSQQSNYIAPFSMQTSFGYFSGTGVYGGFLTGLEFLNINHIPVMLDLQYTLRNSDVMPVLIARGGYAIPSKTHSENYGSDFTYSGGVTGAVGMGLKIRTRESFACDVSLLYRYMQVSYTQENDWQSYPTTYKDVYNRLEIRVGFYLDVLHR